MVYGLRTVNTSPIARRLSECSRQVSWLQVFVPFPFPVSQWVYRKKLLVLQWRDRVGIAPTSLFILQRGTLTSHIHLILVLINSRACVKILSIYRIN